jgi:hypothetical protein
MRWDKDACYRAVKSCREELGEFPGRNQYVVWAKDKDVPNFKTVCAAFEVGTWTEVRIKITKDAKLKAEFGRANGVECCVCEKRTLKYEEYKTVPWNPVGVVFVCRACVDRAVAGDRGVQRKIETYMC